MVVGETVIPMNVSDLPMTHGMEIEQFPADTSTGHTNVYTNDTMSGGIPGECIANSCFDWHRDGSGPQETDFGPYKRCKSMLKKFYSDTVDHTWNWHAADNDGNGAGSHVHFHVEELANDETTHEAWAIAWNSIVDLAPFFAPFFCHNWREGFRNGGGSITQWASPQTTRKRPSTIAGEMRQVRNYNSVTMNGSSSRKPATIEFRMNDAHPAFAMVGSQFVRKVVKDSLEREWSVKLDQREGISLEDLYSQIYNLHRSDTLISAMKEELPEPIVFKDGRGIPGVKKEKFDTMWEVLEKILSQHLPWKGRWDRRVVELVKHAGEWTDDTSTRVGSNFPCPTANNEDLWHVTDEDFSWSVGPEPEAHE